MKIHGAIPESLIYIRTDEADVEYLAEEAKKYNLSGKVRKNGEVGKPKKKK